MTFVIDTSTIQIAVMGGILIALAFWANWLGNKQIKEKHKKQKKQTKAEALTLL